MTPLGPSIIFFSPPFSTGYAFHASRHARPTWAGYVGLAVAGAELLFLIFLMLFNLATINMG